jgi:AsmA protein
MPKFVKWALIVFGIVVLLIAAAVLILPSIIDVQKYKPVLESKLTEATGRSVTVGDDIQLSVFPWAGVSFNDLKVGNPAGFAADDFVAVRAFDVRVKLLPLLLSGFKDIQVQRFVLKAPRVNLIKNGNGKVNWDFSRSGGKTPPRSTPDASGGPALPALSIGDFSITDAEVSYTDQAGGTRHELTDINLEMRNVSIDQPIAVSFSAVFNHHPISLEGVVGPVGSDLKTAAVPVDLKLKLLQVVSGTLQGQVRSPAAAAAVEARLEISEFSARRLLEKLGRPFPVRTTDPNTFERIALRADISGGAESMKISEGRLNLDDSALALTLEVKDYRRPDLRFNIDLNRIDLDRYLPPPGETAEKREDSGSAGARKTDYGPLRRLVLDGRLKIGQLRVKKINAGDISIQVQARDGVIRVDPLQLKMYEGDVSGKSRMDVTGERPQTGVDLQLRNIRINPLLKDATGKDFLEGSTSADVALTMAGEQAEAIKKSLNGSGNLLINDGAVKGIDLANMVRNVKAAFALEEKPKERPRTDFAELSVPFTIREGVFETPSTSLKSPLLRLEAIGKADLVKEKLNFRIDPKVVATIKGQGDEQQRRGLLVPIVVSGSFDSPKFRPDLAGAAKQQLVQDLLKPESEENDGKKSGADQLKDSAQDLLKGILPKKP